MKQLNIVIVLALLAGCSANKQSNNIDNATHTTSIDKEKRVHFMSLAGAISLRNIQDIEQLAKQFRNTDVRFIKLTPVVASKVNNQYLDEAILKVKEVLLKHGVRAHTIHIDQVQYGDENGIRIESATYKVVLPTANEWAYSVGDIDETKSLPNIGVSYEHNLGSMIANPKDLLEPDVLGKVDAQHAISAVRNNSSGASSSSSSSSSSASSSSSSSSI